MRLLLERGRSGERLLDATSATLAAYGYEPQHEGDALQLNNCPFHLLAQEHTGLVCGMNLALLAAAAEQLGKEKLFAPLDPQPHRCYVVLTAG
jgi:predicted ArsR family transcriptional regulator